LAEQTVLAQQRLDLPLPATGDTRHDQVLVRGQDEAAVVALGEAAEPGAHLAGNTPVGDVEAEVPEAVGPLRPAEAIAGALEGERSRLAEPVAEPRFDLGAEPVEPAAVDRVL